MMRGFAADRHSDLGTTIQRNKLMDLPLFVGGNMRNLEQFILLAPGVTGDTGNTQISGSPSRAKEVLGRRRGLDGHRERRRDSR